MRAPRLLLFVLFALVGALCPRAAEIEVSSLADLAREAAHGGRELRLKPGVYRMADYLTEEVLAGIRASVAGLSGRPPVPMLLLRGDDNRIAAEGAVIEIDNALYASLPSGYVRCIIVVGAGNTVRGLTIRHVGENRGSGGNTLSLAGARTTLEDVTVHVYGSWPYGYGDLLGKGGPNLVGIKKQSGIQVLGSGSVLRRCRVYSRAFGHCFYVQEGGNIRLEDCYAEGVMRSTSDMLSETAGPAFDLGFRSVYENRDGLHLMVPGYTKSLSEDGFRTYGNAGVVTLVNCTAINTRAGFEIGVRDAAPTKSVLENCVARGCERGYLIGSQTVVRRSRGDIVHGPLLYLRGGHSSDVELELVGGAPRSLVHAVATIAGRDHRVVISMALGEPPVPAVPIMLGFGMPDHAEMASPIRAAPTENVRLENRIDSLPVLQSDAVKACEVETNGRRLEDFVLRKSPGSWGHAAPRVPRYGSTAGG